MHDLETWTNVIPEISNVLTDGWVYLPEMCTLLTFWTCSLAVNAAAPPPAPEYMLHKVHYQVQQRRNREEFTQTPLGAAYIFGRTMQSFPYKLGCNERARAFPHDEFKERKGNVRSLYSGTVNGGQCFIKTQCLMELSVHIEF